MTGKQSFSSQLDARFLITSDDELRAYMGGTHERIWKKASTHLSAPMQRFIELSPFCCISSYDAQGRTDISPRGDHAGFVAIADERTLVLPDRPGNHRFDTLRNIFETGKISLLFLIPGVSDTLRVNGGAQVTRDPKILTAHEVRGKAPKMAVIITVEEAYGHCSKAILRSRLWEKDAQIPRTDAPSLLELMSAHLEEMTEDPEKVQEIIENDATNNLY